jgi:hypothetical protein
VTKVDFYAGQTLLGTDTAAPFSLGWSGVGVGTYVLTAVATNSAGLTAQSVPVTVTVNAAPPPPAASAPTVTVSLTSPSNGATFTALASITVRASASTASGSISRVEFYAGATLIGTDTTAPYSRTWSNVPAGTYAITARATNSAGLSATSSPASVTVNPQSAPTPPTVTLTQPGAGSSGTAPATFNLAATAATGSGTITKVDFYAGATLIGTDTTAPYTRTWSNVAVGTYALTAVATNSAGLTATSGSVTVFVVAAPPPAPPSVTMTSPSAGSTFTAPASITVAANATTTSGSITQVQFYNGSTLIGSDTTVPYGITWSSVAAGAYSLTARATNSAGLTATSSAVAITVSASAPPPPPSGGSSVTVSSEAALRSAVGNLVSGQTIVITAGTYRLTGPLYVPQGVSNVTIKGATGNRADVVLTGANSVNFGIWVGATSALTVQDLTIQEFTEHGILVNQGAQSPVFRNLIVRNIGDQFIKVNPLGVNNGIVEDSLFEYTTQAPDTYTNGVDVHNGANWIIRRNTFRNFRTSSGLAGPAVLIWNASRDTVVENNTFVGNQRGVALGFDPNQPGTSPVNNPSLTDHAGGRIVNNTFDAAGVANADVQISVADSPNTYVAGNTVRRGNYPNAIEYRFPRTTGVIIENNDVDGAIVGRDGATAIVRNNTGPGGGGGGTPPPPSAPTVSLTAPANGSSFTAPATIAMSASASTSSGSITQVQFYAGSTLVATDTTSPYSATWSGVAAGTYSLTARATNSAGLSTTSSAVSVTVNSGGAPPPPGGSGARLGPTNLNYLGSFSVPSGSEFGYGGTALSFNPTRNSLFIVGHDQQQRVAEISIPGIGGTATLLQGFADATEGKGVGSSSNGTKVGGTLAWGNQLIVTKYLYYAEADRQTSSHFIRPITLSQTGQVQGGFDIGPLLPTFYSGYMGTVPPEWQIRFGGAALTGACCLSIISRTSYGPAVFSFDPSNLGQQQDAEPLVYYPQAHQTLGQYGASGTNDLFNGATRVNGVVFPGGTSSVLFFGTHGIGNYCYGSGSACGDPVDDSQGDHAYPYRPYVWAYDANELAQVRSGQRAPWDARPYTKWVLPIPGNPGDALIIGGAAYDPASARIYVSQLFGDGTRPLIHVYAVVVP